MSSLQEGRHHHIRLNLRASGWWAQHNFLEIFHFDCLQKQRIFISLVRKERTFISFVRKERTFISADPWLQF
jgi:hypothetical protein